MGRPPSIPVEKKTRMVSSVLAGEMSIAEAARREKVSEQSIGGGRLISSRPAKPRGGRQVRSPRREAQLRLRSLI